MSEKKEKVKVCYDGKVKIMKFALTETLANVRKKMGDEIKDDYVFLDGEDQVMTNQEDDFQIEDIIKDGKVTLINTNELDIIKDGKVTLINTNELRPPIKKNKPIDGSIHLKKEKGLEIYLYPSKKFSPVDESKSFSMMVVGQTGSGKTTLLNSLVNYVTGINFDDDFRYVIINEDFGRDQSQSQTSDVNVYYIAPHNGNPPIKIIDTPGFGDTRGIEQDKKITKLIEDKFRDQKSNIATINAICFVVQASNARLTANQKYIFGSIIDMFGKDVAENFISMITFCDGSDPPILEGLQSDDCIFKTTIMPHVKNPWYLKFNNSGIFKKNDASKFSQMYWELGMDSFKFFINKLKRLPPKSLTLTKKVLERRRNLLISVRDLQGRLKDGLSEINSLKSLVPNVLVSNL